MEITNWNLLNICNTLRKRKSKNECVYRIVEAMEGLSIEEMDKRLSEYRALMSNEAKREIWREYQNG